MELLYELLWKACSWFLLSVLVARFISLIVCSTDDCSASGLITEKGIKRSATLDHEDRLRVCDSGSEKKGVKFVAKNVKFVESGFNQDVVKGFEIGEFGEVLVDQNKEEEKLVGFECEVGGKKSVDHVQETIVGFEDRECHGTGVVFGSEGVVDDEKAVENSSNVYKGEISGRGFDREYEGGLSDEEGWEGVERSELENKFAKAMNFVQCKDKEGRLSKGGNDVMMQLYGLQKVAMEGTCHEPQPMALKLSARAKWNAWQRLGTMTQEDAMEQYMTLLSDNIPEWIGDQSSVEQKPRSSTAGVDSSQEDNIFGPSGSVA
ncbi:hypothetical protein SOVF_121700 [Spinacia oleracea]|uniref:Acyl-CoA-binding domain-containing protein 3 n=1 Tax=Spinacia oleracea TaxID=3562 RepID=A0A9R0IC59_SPIOL|nr:acyl-CoA-binding domain-containing protein 3 [Spinacia oleracea]KNA12868.1 hypothetical protein SOVF_121700 [Spinacia oleracea]